MDGGGESPDKEGDLDVVPSTPSNKESSKTLPNSESASKEAQPSSQPKEAQPSSSHPHDDKLGSPGPQKSSNTLEDANNELAKLKREGTLSLKDISNTSAILKEHASLKDKVDKLKSLLGRSAKAQRETKVDLEATQKRLNQSLREIERLNQKLDKLQSRPTHLDLLMDFETNFDKALLSVGQAGGEDTSASPALAAASEQDSAIDLMLMQELGEAKARIEKLESLNSAMMARSTHLETYTRTLQKERDDARTLNERLQMELRLAKMEADHATRAMHDKQASLEEMQMEINLVTKASAKANTRAAKGEEIANSLKSDRQKVQEMVAQVQALQEWAQASAEAKRLIQERCTHLEAKLRQLQGRSLEGDASETLLFQTHGSMVIGAADKSHTIIELGEKASQVDSRFVVLRWKFDSSPPDGSVDFSIMKGKCETDAQQSKADYIIKDRVITGGAGGESEGAFNLDGACTLSWSNLKSWVRPRTVKYTIDVVSLK